MPSIAQAEEELRQRPRKWLVTGAAGFIGSHLVEALLRLDQTVVSLDNFATGHRANLDEVREALGTRRWQRHAFIEADIRDLEQCRRACEGVEVVLHQAALGSVPRSLSDPLATHSVNVDGFVNMLVAARDAGVTRFVYAASSSVYGDDAALPKVENRTGRPLSPYALTKLVDELYAEVFARCYGFASIGLRYFNIFGARQDPEGPYAAVIPRWVRSMLRGDAVVINGDGETSRDFCYVQNAVQANLLAATVDRSDALNQIYNVALNDRTTLNELFARVRDELARHLPKVQSVRAVHGEFRPGDVRHSQAAIDKAQRLLGYEPTHRLDAGLRVAMPWYVQRFGATCAQTR